MNDTPRIYVASLSDYNAGRLHGVWIDLDQDIDDVHEAIRKMLASSPEPGAEEYAIHDHEGFAGLPIGEYDAISDVHERAQGIIDHGPAFAAMLANDYEADDFEEAYCGEWANEQEYAQELAEDIGLLAEANETLARYFDWEAFTRDLFMSDNWSAPSVDGYGIYVFRNI